MLKKFGSLLFIAQLVLIGVPVTFMALLGGFFTVPMFLGVVHPNALPTGIAVLVSYIGLFGFWGVSLAFALRGVAGVRNVSAALWIPTAIGVLMTLSFVARDSFPQAKAFFVFAMFGMPLLIPLAHILFCVGMDKARNSGEADPLASLPR
jgi:hypothetical protein